MLSDNPQNVIISATDAAARFGVTRSTISKWCRTGVLGGCFKASHSVRSTWLIPIAEFARPDIQDRIQVAKLQAKLQAYER